MNERQRVIVVLEKLEEALSRALLAVEQALADLQEEAPKDGRTNDAAHT